VAAGDQVPLVLGWFKTAWEHASSLPRVDLSENWFDDRFTSRVDRATVLRLELSSYPFPR
jgi:hypothetical protein